MFDNWPQKLFSRAKKEDTQVECLLNDDANTPPISLENPELSGGLPDDFWTILIYMPGPVHTQNVDAWRKTPLYQQFKEQLASRASLSIAIELEEQPPLDIKSTSNRRPL